MFHQYAKYSIDGINMKTKKGRLKMKFGFNLKRTPAIMNPKSEINPPRPARHHAIISPQNATRKQTTVAIPRMSGGLGAVAVCLWVPSKKKLINPKRQITNHIVPTTRAATRILFEEVFLFEILVISFMFGRILFKSKLE
jgi:hypothetical protein